VIKLKSNQEKMEFKVSSKVVSMLEGVCNEVTREVVSNLALEYKFDLEEAMKKMKISLKIVKKEEKTKKTKKEKSNIIMPFVGIVDDDLCYGVRLNHGLHTQCENGKKGENKYCSTCLKQSEKNASGKPNNGDIRDRLNCGLLEYRDPKGRQTETYGNVVARLNLDKEMCLREAERLKVKIPEEHWCVSEKKRGRPKKSVTEVSDTTSEKTEKKRGRPKKTKNVVSGVDDDLLAALKAADEETNSEISKKEAKERKAEMALMKQADKEAKQVEKAEKKTTAKKAKEAEKKAAKEAKEAEKKATKGTKAKKTEKKIVIAKDEEISQKQLSKVAEEEEHEDEEEEISQEEKPVIQVEESKVVDEEDDEEISQEEKPVIQVEESKVEDEDEDEETEEEDAVKFVFQGKTYLKTGDNLLYTEDALESSDPTPVGMWCEEKQKILPVDVMSDDEDDE
jgi:hypothetical protein